MSMRWLAACCAFLACAGELRAEAPGYARVDGGRFESVLPPAPGAASVILQPFLLQLVPVTNAEFLAFVQREPQWLRGVVPSVFADAGYLAHWEAPLTLGPSAAPDQPVTRVSWFAATAYCEAADARLPTWHEWERAAAADETRSDARGDPQWRQQILDWYARSGGAPLPAVGQRSANRYGLRDLHGLVWEWVEDVGSLLVSGDSREQGDPDLLKYCGSGALELEQKEHYAVLMRVAMLTSLPAAGTTALLGFRCARDFALGGT